jgi:hypothetical protein
MSEDIFESYPDKRGQEENEGRKVPLDTGKTPGKQGPKKSKIKNENSVYEKANSDGKIAVVSWHRWNPVNQDCVEPNPSKKTEQKGLLWRFFVKR